MINFENTATAGPSNVTYTAYGADTFVYNEAFFYGNSSAGSATFVAYGASHGLDAGGGLFNFYDNSTAENANFTINGAQNNGGYGGSAGFSDFATAGNATFVLNPAAGNFDAGHMGFRGNATAGHGVFTLNGATVCCTETEIDFTDAATGGDGFFTVMGGHKSSALGGLLYFYGFTFTGLITTAGNATIINEGGTAAGARGGFTDFSTSATAGQALIVANGGENGGGPGGIHFYDDGDGGEAQIEVYGNGFIDISYRLTPSVTIGSLAGDGVALLGSNNLTVGSNNLDTTFSGAIKDGGFGGGTGGSLTKIGAGTLSLSAANTYTGKTIVSGGTLKVTNTSGSGTGTGVVKVNAGTLAGKGIVSGAVTIGIGSGAGAILAPGEGAGKPTTMTLQSTLTLKADSTYSCKVSLKKAKADKVVTSGVTIKSGALFTFPSIGQGTLAVGTVFTVIDNSATSAIDGAFSNLPDGSTITRGGNTFQADYEGGDGNDLTLTVVP